MNKYGLIIVLILLLWWYSILQYQNQILYNTISGFWEADAEFLNESGLDTFCIYFDKPESVSVSCYLLAKKGDDLILNEPVIVDITNQWWSNWSLDIETPKYFNIHFKELDNTFFPEYQEMRLYFNCNKIVLYKDDSIYAVLYKNGHSTELKYKSELDNDLDSESDCD